MNGVQLPHDIEGEIAGAAVSWGMVVLVLLVLALIGALIWKLVRRKAPPPQPAESVSQQIKRRIRELRLREGFSHQELRAWAFELGQILRSAGEERWQIPATDRTVEELVSEFKNRNFAADQRELADQVISILKKLDLVQFADQQIDLDATRKLYDECRSITDRLMGEAA